jgi:FKBP-type peptidyl-prolyl cis-trans isomerase 2
MNPIKPGDQVEFNYTGQSEMWTVVSTTDRNQSESTPGVVLLGNALVIQNTAGVKVQVLEWDVFRPGELDDLE